MTRTQTRSQTALTRLIADAERHLTTLQYTPDTIRHYRHCWSALERFAGRRRRTVFSGELADAFLESRGMPLAASAESSYPRMIRTSLRVLSEFQRDGCFQRRRSAIAPIPLPRSMNCALESYLVHCTDHLGNHPRTMRIRTRHLTTFLNFSVMRGRKTARAITAADVSAFVRSRSHLASKTVAVEVATLRSFFRVGSVIGIVAPDMTGHIPRVRIQADCRIPTVWRDGDVDTLLSAVDRASPIGKRNYAILLLACRLGMRAGDIRELKLEDIQWESGCIVRTQGKTGGVLQLPLPEDAGEALIDYLRHGRPVTTRREVFLRTVAPFEPFGRDNNLHEVITRYRRLAGIPAQHHSRMGLHSLRHTLASRLLSNNVSLTTIAAILGQDSLDATRIYTKVDIRALRTAALEADGGTNG